MKRVAAIFLLLCCLMSIVPMAYAVGRSETAKAEAAEETQQENEVLGVIEGSTAIRTMHVEVKLDEKGRAFVTQTIEMNIIGEPEELRFSVPDYAKKIKVKGYRAKNEKERGVRYCVIKDRKGFDDEETFEITYEIRDGLVSETKDSQKLTVPVLTVQDYRVGQFTFDVALPDEFASTPRFSSGYYGDDIEDVMTVNTGNSWVIGTVGTILQDNETLTMTLVLPVGFFKGNHGESAFPIVMTVIVLLLLVGVVVYWARFLKNARITVRSRTLPPDGVNPGDLPFLLAGGNTDFNMLVSHWAVLGYLSIYVNREGNVVLRRRMQMGNERRMMERKLFGLLFAESDLCDGASLRYKKVGEKAMQVTRSYWSKRLYEKHSGAPFVAWAVCWLACGLAAMVAMNGIAPDVGKGFFLFLSLIAGTAMGTMITRTVGAFYLVQKLYAAIGAGCALLLLIVGIAGGGMLAVLPAVGVSLFISWQTCHGGMRCAYGDEVIGQTLGFRRFLLRTSEHHALQMLVRDPQYFYKILPYAEAMGLGGRFVALFHDCKLEPCQWYEAARGIPSTASAFYEHYRDTLEMLNLSIKK